MQHYVASYIPLVREAEVLRWDPSSRRKPTILKISSAFELKALLEPGDHIWLMMGSTNAAVALAAFRKGVVIHQLSLPRLSTWLNKVEGNEDDGKGNRRLMRSVESTYVLRAAQEAPHLFYGMSTAQAEVLEISAAWQAVEDAMEARKAAANLVRARVHQEAIIHGRVRGKSLPANPKEAETALEAILSDLLDNRDEQSRRRIPSDPHIAFLVDEENRERARLEAVCKNNGFYHHLFGDVEGVGPMLGARFIAAIERIERFVRPEDLSNYAGMLPRGKEGHLPSRTKGQALSRSPRFNTACFLLQDYMFQWGRKTELGQILYQQVERECPCTAEQRKGNKDLRRRHAIAVKEARIAMTRHFLEAIIWPRWREYMGLNLKGEVF